MDQLQREIHLHVLCAVRGGIETVSSGEIEELIQKCHPEPLIFSLDKFAEETGMKEAARRNDAFPVICNPFYISFLTE